MASLTESSMWVLGRGMTSCTGIGISTGRLNTIRTILSSHIRSIGCVVVDCKRKRKKSDGILVGEGIKIYVHYRTP